MPIKFQFEIESLITGKFEFCKVAVWPHNNDAEPPARKSYPEDMPQACRDFARSLETAQVPRHFLAMSNEYIVFVSYKTTISAHNIPFSH